MPVPLPGLAWWRAGGGLPNLPPAGPWIQRLPGCLWYQETEKLSAVGSPRTTVSAPPGARPAICTLCGPCCDQVPGQLVVVLFLSRVRVQDGPGRVPCLVDRVLHGFEPGAGARMRVGVTRAVTEGEDIWIRGSQDRGRRVGERTGTDARQDQVGQVHGAGGGNRGGNVPGAVGLEGGNTLRPAQLGPKA